MSRSLPLLLAVGAALPLAAGAAGGASAAGAPALPALLGCTGARLVRPAGTVILACADANAEISRTRWRTWTATAATGTTDLGINLCTPTCVASRIRFFPGSTIRLVSPERTRQGLVFTRARITYVLGGKRTTITAYPAT